MTIYTPTSITGYNSNPPADDGSAVESNEIEWAKHKQKLADPIKTALESINTNLVSAFGKIAFNGPRSYSTNQTLGVADRGKIILTTNAITLSFAAASTLTNDWFCVVLVTDSNNVILDPNSSETINGASTITLDEQYKWAFVYSDGTNLYALVKQSAPEEDVAATDATIATGDKINYFDVDDSENKKSDTVQGILDLVAPDLAGKADTAITADDKITFYDDTDSDLPKTDTVEGVVDVVASSLSSKADTAITAADKITFYDSTDSDLPKTDTVQGVIDLANPQTAGAVGTYMFGRNTTQYVAFGATLAGSKIFPCGVEGVVGDVAGSAVSGTWRCMGRTNTSSQDAGRTLWLRIS